MLSLRWLAKLWPQSYCRRYNEAKVETAGEESADMADLLQTSPPTANDCLL